MELRKSFLFGKIGVPQSDDLVHIEFSCQIAGYPPVSEIHEDDVHRLEMSERFLVDLLDDSLHLVYHLMYTRLHFGVVILNVIN